KWLIAQPGDKEDDISKVLAQYSFNQIAYWPSCLNEFVDLVRRFGETPEAFRSTVKIEQRDAQIQADEQRQELNVLVAEDNIANQELMRAMAAKIGLNIEIANNGSEALTASMRGNFDLIFMDCQMPVMDGYEATRQIRTELSPQKQQPTIIAMTANALQGDREKCIASGMDDYLSKPLNTNDLKDIILRWLPNSLPI
ncbi:MAG: response regulator, partial [Calditrichaeota bacterium]|nr:response regulator [Calditrichota bacterium]